jgi:hypothetical protein
VIVATKRALVAPADVTATAYANAWTTWTTTR